MDISSSSLCYIARRSCFTKNSLIKQATVRKNCLTSSTIGTEVISTMTIDHNYAKRTLICRVFFTRVHVITVTAPTSR
jgi:hypothetical protein